MVLLRRHSYNHARRLESDPARARSLAIACGHRRHLLVAQQLRRKPCARGALALLAILPGAVTHEDENLRHHVMTLETMRWSLIAKALPGMAYIRVYVTQYENEAHAGHWEDGRGRRGVRHSDSDERGEGPERWRVWCGMRGGVV